MLRRLALIAVTMLLVVHGLVCLTGATRDLGWLWVASGLLALTAAVQLVVDRRHWWIVGALAVVVSQAAIVTTWSQAWAGTIVNALLAVAVLYGWRSQGRSSARARYRRAVAALSAADEGDAVVTEDDLQALPAPIAR